MLARTLGFTGEITAALTVLTPVPALALVEAAPVLTEGREGRLPDELDDVVGRDETLFRAGTVETDGRLAAVVAVGLA
jgi:hypothetical protein